MARDHADLAFDFELVHRGQRDRLVDSISCAGYHPELGASPGNLQMVDKIKAYADRYIAPRCGNGDHRHPDPLETASRRSTRG